VCLKRSSAAGVTREASRGEGARAERSRERGDETLARMHEDNADLQAEAAEAAERRRLAEGERIGEPVRDTRDA
jgi:hypothetical protein